VPCSFGVDKRQLTACVPDEAVIKKDFWQNLIRESFDRLCRQVSGLIAV